MSTTSKDPAGLRKYLDGVNLDTPDVVVLSGSDTSVFPGTVETVRALLEKKVGSFEVTTFSGEPDDDRRFQEEIFNIPLFAPYRLVIVRQGHDVFRQAVQSPSVATALQEEFSRLPDRTFILIEYAGDPGARFLKLFGDRLHHSVSRDLYSNQVLDVILGLSKRIGVQLTEEALHEFKEKIEPRGGVIELALQRLKERLPPGEKEIGVEALREVLFPHPGMNVFALVDALYAGNHRVVERELGHFNPPEDNFFVIFKLMLNRANEIRRAAVARSHGTRDDELVKMLGLKGRPPFIQKKILQRLHAEVPRYWPDRLGHVYDFLFEMQVDFRYTVPVAHQPAVFQEKILPIFFN